MNAEWYVLRTKPHKEHAVYQQVTLGNYDAYYPHLRVKPVNPRSRRIVPYFPGYLFVHVDLEQLGQSIFRWIPFSTGLVTFGSEPARVPENFIHALQTQLDELNKKGPQPTQSFSKGEKVVIRKGPFEGYSALFDTHMSGRERAKVLIKFLNGQNVRLDVNINNIESRMA